MNKYKSYKIMYIIGVFAVMFINYAVIHPIMPVIPDDWTYIGYIRYPWPTLHTFNPTKVLPETLTGLCGQFAARIVYPIIGDYTTSIVYVFSAVLSIFVCIYLISVWKLIKELTAGKDVEIFFIMLLFFSLHFVLLKRHSSGNIYLFHAICLTEYTNYTVPFCLAASISTWFIRRYITHGRCLFEEYQNIDIGWVILATYFSIFSNMVANIVLIAPLITVGIYELYKTAWKNRVFSLQTIKEYWYYIYVALLEMICLAFEYNGGRAALATTDNTENQQVIKTIINTFKLFNSYYVVIIILIFIIFLIIRKKVLDYKSKVIVYISTFSFLIILAYLIALFLRVKHISYLQRGDNLLILLFYPGIMLCLFLHLIMKYKPKIMGILPLSVCISGIFAFGQLGYESAEAIYKDSLLGFYSSAEDCHEANERIVEQFINADRAGLIEFRLEVPEAIGRYSFGGERVAVTLYRQGVTGRRLKPEMVLIGDDY